MQYKNPEYFRRIEDCIDEYQTDRGIIPCNYEISKGIRLSTATVSKYLSHMKEGGHIIYDRYKSIRTRPVQKQIRFIKKIPLVGDISCGLLLSAEEILRNISFPSSLLEDKEYFFLRAKGDSMIEIGITEGI